MNMNMNLPKRSAAIAAMPELLKQLHTVYIRLTLEAADTTDPFPCRAMIPDIRAALLAAGCTETKDETR